MQRIENEIRQFVIENFLFGVDDGRLSNEESLMGRGIVDSTGVLEIVAFLETRYNVAINADDILPSNLDSISHMVNFLARKRTTSGAPPTER
jgi:acyl carrier protein